MIAAAPVPVHPSLAPFPRFTLDGDAALEAHLAQACSGVRSGIRGLFSTAKLEAVLLGGGYGRGEGGVLRSSVGDRPYNDLEFYIALRGNRHLNEFRYHRRVEVLGEILTPLAGVEIEFKITSLAQLAAQPVSMFSYDLVSGHRLWSNAPLPHLQGCAAHRSAGNIPVAEATRLLMNRCSGLLFARAELAHTPFTTTAADFVRRNIAKVQLACGDALLASRGDYHWSCLERHRRLGQLVAREPSPWHDTVLSHHTIGVDFKLHPTSAALARGPLATLHHEVTALALHTWLTLESSRLHADFPSARAYAEYLGDLCPGTPRLRNFALNFRANGCRFRTPPSPWRHPRQRIYRALVLLLWQPDTFSTDALRHRLAIELGAPVHDFATAVAAYRTLWARLR